VNPRYQDALQVLNYVLNTLIRSDGLLLVLIPPIHLHRLQNLLYTSGNLRSVVTRSSRAGIHDYNRALELAFRHPVAMDTGDQIRFHDVIIATVVIGLLATTPPHLNILNATASALGVDPGRFTNRMLEQSIDWLSLVHRAGKALVDVLLREGKGVLPMILLTPEKASRIPEVLFGVYARNLPALCVRASYEDSWSPAPGVDVSAMNKVTSNVLLTLARLLLHNQDLRDFTDFLDPTRHIPPSQSLVAALYYLAVSLNPTPSTYNNMGILFFSINQSASLINAEGQPEAINGVTLAQMYYKRGLAMEPYHPHLLTNYGSLLKDQGHPLEAIKCVNLHALV
jgi:protein O-GlcNAc transferase